MEWFLMAWNRAADFDGRSRRKEYWMFTLFNCLVCIALMIPYMAFARTGIGTFCLILLFAYELASTVPTWSCSVRRLHDIGKSGWWLLIYLIPLVGLILIVFFALDGEPGNNEYGPNPKSPQQPAWIS
jgi:uncharacterized membrane protein YhaH (DUF805 family)